MAVVRQQGRTRGKWRPAGSNNKGPRAATSKSRGWNQKGDKKEKAHSCRTIEWEGAVDLGTADRESDLG